MEFKDYYATLGVPKAATADDIKRAYRKLARQYHPDVNPGDKAAETRFKEINEANEVLGDQDKRRKYDELGANWREYEAQGRGPGGSGFESWPGGTSYRSVSPEEFERMFGGGGRGGADPFSDFFHAFFDAGGRAGGGGRGRSRKGADAEFVADLTLEEAFAGATRRLTTRGGKGERTFDVRIPAGVDDASRVRVAGEGGPGASGGQAGDLFVTIRLTPHARFERRGADLYTKASVPLTTAVLGGDVAVTSMSGSTLRLKVPELTASGRVFRLRGHGMPVVGKPDVRGDLYVAVDIALPERLTPDAREHYEALRRLETGTP